MSYNGVFLGVQCLHWLEQSAWYTVEQYGEKTDWNIGMLVSVGYGAAVMPS